MVHAYHSIITTYGFWLPNDPRGSYSDFTAAWELWFEGGKATKVNTTRSVAHKPHNRDERMRVKTALDYPSVVMNDEQIASIANGFTNAVKKRGYTIYACSILPEHIHLVIGRHRLMIERLIGHLKMEGTMSLINERLHPFQDMKRPDGRLVSCWAERSWSVYLDCEADIRRAIKYVRENPVKVRLPAQRWKFEKEYGELSFIPRPDERAG